MIDVPKQTLWRGGSSYWASQASRKPGASATGGSETRYAAAAAGVLLGPGVKLVVSVMVVLPSVSCIRCLLAVGVPCKGIEGAGRRGRGGGGNSVSSGNEVSARVRLHNQTVNVKLASCAPMHVMVSAGTLHACRSSQQHTPTGRPVLQDLFGFSFLCALPWRQRRYRGALRVMAALPCALAQTAWCAMNNLCSPGRSCLCQWGPK